MSHLEQEIQIRIAGVEVGQPQTLKELKKLAAEEIVEESFEEAGVLCSSKREAIRKPAYFSRKACKDNYNAYRISKGRSTTTSQAKIVKPAKASVYKRNILSLDSSWQNAAALEDELPCKGFKYYYDVETRDAKGLKLGTIRVESEEAAKFVSAADFRGAKAAITNELKNAWLCER